MKKQSPKVFISYKWEDADHNLWVEKLARDLRIRDIDAILDKWEVKLGESFSDYMTESISMCDAFLFIMTPKSIDAVEGNKTGGAVRFEVQIATARKIAGENFRFIGILRKGDKIATHLRDSRYIDFRSDSNYPQVLSNLVEDIRGITRKPELPKKQNISLIAEPIVNRIWQSLPHGIMSLVEPASPELQTAITNGLVEILDQKSSVRNYDFVLSTIDIGKYDQKSFAKLLEHIFQNGILSLQDNRISEDRETKLQIFSFVSCEAIGSSALKSVLIIKTAGKYNKSIHNKLQSLRRLVQEHAYRDKTKDNFSIIIMITSLLYDFDVMVSPWWNLCQHLRPEIE